MSVRIVKLVRILDRSNIKIGAGASDCNDKNRPKNQNPKMSADGARLRPNHILSLSMRTV